MEMVIDSLVFRCSLAATAARDHWKTDRGQACVAHQATDPLKKARVKREPFVEN
jgi:hypothetical protein